MVPRAYDIIAVAQRELYAGLAEQPVGSNDGHALRVFLKDTPFLAGESWCYYFALACLLEVFGSKDNLPKSVAFTGSCQVAADLALSQYKLSDYAATGSIFVLPNEEGHFHHAGIVRDVFPAFSQWNASGHPVIATIEGNTNNNRSSNGYGVFQHVRQESFQKYIIW